MFADRFLRCDFSAALIDWHRNNRHGSAIRSWASLSGSVIELWEFNDVTDPEESRD